MWGLEGCDAVDPQYPHYPPGSTESTGNTPEAESFLTTHHGSDEPFRK